MSDRPLHELVGYDYIATVRQLLGCMTYESLAFAIGYESVGSISGILRGGVPGHRQGEAMWALYIETFGHKPPMRLSACDSETSSV